MTAEEIARLAEAEARAVAAECDLAKLIGALREVEALAEAQRLAGLRVNVARGNLSRILNEVDE